MKKTSKLLGAIALSAAMVVGCAMPAFAATEAKTSDPADIDETNASNAATVINLRTETDQIDCSLPLKMTVVAKVEGGDILCPTPEKYAIENKNADAALYVNKIVTDLEGDWVPSTATYADATPADVGQGKLAPTADGKKGTVLMNLTATGQAKNTDVLLIGNNTNFGNGATADNVSWTINPGDTQGLTLAGKTSKIKDLPTSEASGVTLVTVKYTVSAMPTGSETTLAE